MGKKQVQVRKDSSEIVHYDYSDFLAYIRKGDLSSYYNYAANTHWHEDIEMIAVLSGRMLYNVNGTIVRLREGEGILVNSKQMHYGFSDDKTECEYICLLLHPMLLCASQQVETDLVNPFVSDSSIPYVHLHGRVAWEKRVLEAIQEIYDMRGEKTARMRIQGLFCQIWAELLDNMESCRKYFAGQKKQDQKLSALKKMLDYIQKNYPEKVTLEDIAAVGYISKSTCLSIFKKYLGESPVNYLIHYRLKLGADLLRNSDLTVTNIAYQVGFSNVSYFVETFHKVYGCQPLEYRKENKQ